MLCAYVMSTLIVYSLDNVRVADNLMPHSVFNYRARLLICGTGRWSDSEAPAVPTLEIAFISRYLTFVLSPSAKGGF